MEILIVGQRFGKLLVTKKLDERRWGHRVYECLCDCGKVTKSISQQLREGTKKSCGCGVREALLKSSFIHGMSKTPIHNLWYSMIQRCTDKNNKHYADYGGRGITVCKEWMEFVNFYRDMGDRPEGKTLDRIDNNKGYFKENCRWATKTEQANNRRSSKFITYKDETLTQAQWEDRLGLRKGLLYDRIKRGWSIEKAIETPLITIYR